MNVSEVLCALIQKRVTAVFALAKDFPAERLTWEPAPGTRSVLNQLQEIATALDFLQSALETRKFERNPEGLDNPELFKQLFLKDAAKSAQLVIDKAKPEFQAKSLHQKVELDPPEVLSTRDNAFYTSVDVQLIRVGAYQGAPITEVLRYRVKFKFLLNPDLTRNGRFPTAVAAFQVEPVGKT